MRVLGRKAYLGHLKKREDKSLHTGQKPCCQRRHNSGHGFSSSLYQRLCVLCVFSSDCPTILFAVSSPLCKESLPDSLTYSLFSFRGRNLYSRAFRGPSLSSSAPKVVTGAQRTLKCCFSEGRTLGTQLGLGGELEA